MDIQNIRYKIETEFHLLRHFAAVSDELLQRLHAAGYTQLQISDILSLPGSRFHASFAKSIQDILSHVNDAIIDEQVGINGNHIVSAKFNPLNCKSGIGTVAVIPFDSLDASKQMNVYKADNRGHYLKHLEVEALPYTWELTMVLAKTEEGWSLITAFPGASAMPLPNPQMDKDIYNQILAFWEGQVFLVENNNL